MTKFGADPQATFRLFAQQKFWYFSTLIMNYEKLYHHSNQCTNSNHKIDIAIRMNRNQT